MWKTKIESMTIFATTEGSYKFSLLFIQCDFYTFKKTDQNCRWDGVGEMDLGFLLNS